MDHKELLDELSELERLPTEDRLKQARKRRAQQLKRFSTYDKAKDKEESRKRKKNLVNNNYVAREKRTVDFDPEIVLLEAAARDDVEEGGCGKLGLDSIIYNFHISLLEDT